MTKNLFYVGMILAATGLISPPVALALGLVYGLTTVHHFHVESRNLSKFLLQAAVVCLGFGMNLGEVVHAGRSGFLYTAVSIAFALGLGTLLGKVLKVGKTQSLLISFGTAICGGSAIAAMGPVLQAGEEELAVGTTVKLARALWIVPLALGTAMLKKSKTKVRVPWFILYFALAAVVATYLPRFMPQSAGLMVALNRLGRAGLTVVLFLIGTGITRTTLREVGARPLVQGVALWIVVASLSLWVIMKGWIGI